MDLGKAVEQAAAQHQQHILLEKRRELQSRIESSKGTKKDMKEVGRLNNKMFNNGKGMMRPVTHRRPPPLIPVIPAPRRTTPSLMTTPRRGAAVPNTPRNTGAPIERSVEFNAPRCPGGCMRYDEEAREAAARVRARQQAERERASAQGKVMSPRERAVQYEKQRQAALK